MILGERQDSDPLCQSIKELKIFPDQPPTSTVWSFISGFQNNPVEKTYETFAKISDVLCKLINVYNLAQYICKMMYANYFYDI